jgi:amino acid transporter/mannitol/fructose-specific phosphotransferase system IIA component (Ntr-type)
LKLKKQLNLLDVFSLAAGTMISSGIFVLPGLIFARAGPSMVLAYALASLLTVPALFAQAELASAMPRAGGSYFFIERSLGTLAGTFAGLAHWFSVALKSAFALIGIGAIASMVFPQISELNIRLIAAFCCIFFAVLNLLSVRNVKRIQVFLVLFVIALLVWFISCGLWVMDAGHFQNFIPRGFAPIITTAGLVFISFQGLEKIVSVGEEINRPGKNIPKGMFLAFGVVSALYILVIFIVVGDADVSRLSGSLTPISLAAEGFAGPVGSGLMAFAALGAFFTTANSGILAASRAPMAMSRDGLLPEVFQRVSKRFKTPHSAILITSAFMAFVILFLSLENLVKAASVMTLVLFALVNAAVGIMRQSNIPNYRPKFRAPFSPWLQLAAIIAYCALIIGMGLTPIIFAGIFAAVAVGWYIVYVNPRVDRESAFVYLVKSIAAPVMTRSDLEEELKQIAIERDEVVHDQFDHAVRDCEVLDLGGEVTPQSMFELVSEKMSEKIDTDKNKLLNLFLDRESKSSTNIHPGLAIPHIIVEGRKIFKLMLVRARPGVKFTELSPPVNTIFVIMSSPDKRHFHLQALMAIAHIVQEEGFEQRWLAAQNPEQLRDIVLLSSRKRAT